MMGEGCIDRAVGVEAGDATLTAQQKPPVRIESNASDQFRAEIEYAGVCETRVQRTIGIKPHQRGFTAKLGENLPIRLKRQITDLRHELIRKSSNDVAVIAKAVIRRTVRLEAAEEIAVNEEPFPTGGSTADQ